MLDLQRIGDVCVVRSTLIASRHGFSTRLGGKSTLPHTATLNLARGRGDDDATVAQNLAIFANALSVDAERIVSVPQIHSGDVRRVDMRHSGMGTSRMASFSCDGYVTNCNNLPVAVKTADCVPILLEARGASGEVIAVSAVHAGWRGTAERIAANAVRELVALGAKESEIYAAIGPAIDVCCYEVKEDFTISICEKLGQFYENNFIKRRDGRLFADIKGMNRAILEDVGVPTENIDVCELCTCCKEELFYSHRRQNGVRGTQMSLICK